MPLGAGILHWVLACHTIEVKTIGKLFFQCNQQSGVQSIRHLIAGALGHLALGHSTLFIHNYNYTTMCSVVCSVLSLCI